MFKKLFKRKYNYEIDPEDIFLDSSNLSSFDTENLEGSISRPISRTYSSLLFFVLVGVFLIFSFKMYSLGYVYHDYYQKKSDNNSINSTIIFAPRGQILDRNSLPLAFNIMSSSSLPLTRNYVSGGLSNLLGYVSYPKADASGNYWQENYNGKDGLEMYYNTLLTGTNGKKLIEKNVTNDIEGDNVITAAIPGRDLTISIDKDLQKKMFDSIKSVVDTRGYISGTGILMNIEDGEVLAMTNYPEYDNNLMTNATGTVDNKKISAMLSDKRTPFLNRAVSGLFVPGSVVKPYVAYAAIKEGVITPQKQILSTGALIVKNIYGGPDSVFKDWKAHGYVNAVRAIAQSSDEYFYQVGGGYKEQKGLGISKLDEYAKMFGFGSATGIDIGNENSGVIPTPDWKRVNFIDGEWRLGNTYHTSIGQYGFQITLLELVRYISAIANGGYLVTPHLYLSSSSTEMQNKNWPKENINLDQDILKYVRQGMKEAVEPGGTSVLLSVPGLKIAAKSGTAELGLVKGKVNSLITGYFPYDDPKYAFAFIMENGNLGGTSGSIQAAQPLLQYFKDNKGEYLK